MAVTQTFKALGDPVRLRILERLSTGSSYTLGSVSEGLGLTRQGVRKHMQVLVEARLITLIVKGRETKVTLNPSSLLKARSFIAGLELRWDERLEALRNFAEQ